MKGIIGNNSDIIIRKFSFISKKNIQAALIFIDGLIDKNLVNENIMKPLMFNVNYIYDEEIDNIQYLESTYPFCHNSSYRLLKVP